MSGFTDSEMFATVGIPVLICLARILDVSIGTLRIIFVSRGLKYMAPALGFFEVIIWLVAIGQIMNNLTNAVNYVAYGLGFAIGNYVGIILEERISLGYVLLRVITRIQAVELKQYFRRSGRKFTMVDGFSDDGPINIIYLPLKRKDVPEVVKDIKRYNPKAFYTLEDVRSISSDVSIVQPRPIRKWSRYRFLPRFKKK